MRKTKISIAITPELVEEIANYVKRREISRFIEKALQNELERIKHDSLIEAYRESAQEAENENRFFEGATDDGLSQTW
ncbi:MAG TPA: hypothetical protein VK186_11710 [Candidatus Deferrimicrobium sp.]|nr:hypothetical protein [Candidatus Kapabacteria bacterium]HLP59492.1 hypothetical protein [Candidatus Deferrimicrobium sp.]